MLWKNCLNFNLEQLSHSMSVGNIASLAVSMEICFFAVICINSAWVNESHQLYIVEFWWPDKLPHKISAKSEHICSSYSILKIGKFYIQFLAPIINIWRSLAQARLYIKFISIQRTIILCGSLDVQRCPKKHLNTFLPKIIWGRTNL